MERDKKRNTTPVVRRHVRLDSVGCQLASAPPTWDNPFPVLDRKKDNKKKKETVKAHRADRTPLTNEKRKE